MEKPKDFGDRLYEKAKLLEEQRKKRIQEKVEEKERKEKEELTFKPNITNLGKSQKREQKDLFDINIEWVC